MIEESELVFWLLTVYMTDTRLIGLCDTRTAQYNEKSTLIFSSLMKISYM